MGKREFKKLKREKVAKGNLKVKREIWAKGNLNLKREICPPSGLRSKKGNLNTPATPKACGSGKVKQFQEKGPFVNSTFYIGL